MLCFFNRIVWIYFTVLVGTVLFWGWVVTPIEEARGCS